jgi:hypothetical protein
MKRRTALGLLAVPVLGGQQLGVPVEAGPVNEFICPMDRDVQAPNPGRCPRCGMKLVANLPEPEEYQLRIRTRPKTITAGRPVEMEFAVLDPYSDAVVTDFEVIHEKLFHLFLVSQDLQHFAHEHPEAAGQGLFRYRHVFPAPGAYRVAADCYPAGGTPQFLVRTLITRGARLERLAKEVRLEPSAGPQRGENLTVELFTEPAQPLAGRETLLFFRLSPGDGLEQYLGAWGHMLAASDDLIDLIHEHPLYVTAGPQIQFNIIFPRERSYRLWAQFRRRGVLNTVAFNVTVRALR